MDGDVRNPAFREKVEQIFARAPFVTRMGIRLSDVAPGRVETRLSLEPWHLQQNGYAHAGVLTTLADHTAGAAAGTLIQADQGVLSVEFKVNLLRAAQGPELWCRSQVLKAGKTLSVVESEVFSGPEGQRVLAAKATVTLAIVPDTTLPASVAR